LHCHLRIAVLNSRRITLVMLLLSSILNLITRILDIV
jgi:hypothetical protein